jgi:hypothetical protein
MFQPNRRIDTEKGARRKAPGRHVSKPAEFCPRLDIQLIMISLGVIQNPTCDASQARTMPVLATPLRLRTNPPRALIQLLEMRFNL